MQKSCLQSLKLLSVIAAIRLDNETDNIESTLSLGLVDTAKSGNLNRSIQSSDPLASSSWEEVIDFIGICFDVFRTLICAQ